MYTYYICSVYTHIDCKHTIEELIITTSTTNKVNTQTKKSSLSHQKAAQQHHYHFHNYNSSLFTNQLNRRSNSVLHKSPKNKKPKTIAKKFAEVHHRSIRRRRRRRQQLDRKCRHFDAMIAISQPPPSLPPFPSPSLFQQPLRLRRFLRSFVVVSTIITPSTPPSPSLKEL